MFSSGFVLDSQDGVNMNYHCVLLMNIVDINKLLIPHSLFYITKTFLKNIILKVDAGKFFSSSIHLFIESIFIK